MTIDQINSRIQAIQASDPERAHGLLDDLNRDFVRFVSNAGIDLHGINKMAALVMLAEALVPVRGYGIPEIPNTRLNSFLDQAEECLKIKNHTGALHFCLGAIKILAKGRHETVSKAAGRGLIHDFTVEERLWLIENLSQAIGWAKYRNHQTETPQFLAIAEPILKKLQASDPLAGGASS